MAASEVEREFTAPQHVPIDYRPIVAVVAVVIFSLGMIAFLFALRAGLDAAAHQGGGRSPFSMRSGIGCPLALSFSIKRLSTAGPIPSQLPL
jgi:hypothetical protein